MQTTKQTHANVRHEQKEALRASICEILQWRELELNAFLFEQGIKYLETWMPEIHAEGDAPEKGKENKQFWISAFSRTTTFWQWWKNHWINRDEAFLDGLNFNLSRETLRRIYREVHNGEVLGQDITPHGSILERTYGEMIDLMTKECENDA